MNRYFSGRKQLRTPIRGHSRISVTFPLGYLLGKCTRTHEKTRGNKSLCRGFIRFSSEIVSPRMACTPPDEIFEKDLSKHLARLAPEFKFPGTPIIATLLWLLLQEKRILIWEFLLQQSASCDLLMACIIAYVLRSNNHMGCESSPMPESEFFRMLREKFGTSPEFWCATPTVYRRKKTRYPLGPNNGHVEDFLFGTPISAIAPVLWVFGFRSNFGDYTTVSNTFSRRIVSTAVAVFDVATLLYVTPHLVWDGKSQVYRFFSRSPRCPIRCSTIKSSIERIATRGLSPALCVSWITDPMNDKTLVNALQEALLEYGTPDVGLAIQKANNAFGLFLIKRIHDWPATCSLLMDHTFDYMHGTIDIVKAVLATFRRYEVLIQRGDPHSELASQFIAFWPALLRDFATSESRRQAVQRLHRISAQHEHRAAQAAQRRGTPLMSHLEALAKFSAYFSAFMDTGAHTKSAFL